MTATITKTLETEVQNGEHPILTKELLKLGADWNERSDNYTKALIAKYKFPTPDTVIEYRRAKELFTITQDTLQRECNNDSVCIRAAITGKKAEKKIKKAR